MGWNGWLVCCQCTGVGRKKITDRIGKDGKEIVVVGLDDFFFFFKSWLAHIYEAPSIQFLENVEYTQKTDLTDQLGKKSGRRSVFLMLVFKIYFEWKKNTQVEKEREVRERNCEKPLNPIYQTILFPPGLPKAFNSHLT